MKRKKDVCFSFLISWHSSSFVAYYMSYVTYFLCSKACVRVNVEVLECFSFVDNEQLNERIALKLKKSSDDKKKVTKIEMRVNIDFAHPIDQYIYYTHPSLHTICHTRCILIACEYNENGIWYYAYAHKCSQPILLNRCSNHFGFYCVFMLISLFQFEQAHCAQVWLLYTCSYLSADCSTSEMPCKALVIVEQMLIDCDVNVSFSSFFFCSNRCSMQ